MDIVGRHLPIDFWQGHPESESALRGLLTIVAAADWRGADDIGRHLGNAATLKEEGRVTVSDPDGQFQLDLRVSYDRQLVHIISIHRGDA